MEPLPDAIKHVFRLPSALAVKHRVIRVPGEPDARQTERVNDNETSGMII